MASIPISTQPTNQSRDFWITPCEQMLRLSRPLVKNCLVKGGRDDGLRLPPYVISKIALEFFKLSDQLPRGPHSLPSNFTNWYTALKRIDALPDKIPALPLNIHEILRSACPIFSTDKTLRTIGETHSLYLIPPGTLNELEQRVSRYGQQFFQGENPLKFRYFWNEARQEHGDIPVDEPRWVLITNDVLLGSRNQPYERQAQMITDLNERNSTNYQVPTLRETVLSLFLERIATGTSLYQEGNEQNGNQYTYTRVAETTRDWHLIVGGFAPSGLRVYYFGYDYAAGSDGMAALRKF